VVLRDYGAHERAVGLMEGRCTSSVGVLECGFDSLVCVCEVDRAKMVVVLCVVIGSLSRGVLSRVEASFQKRGRLALHSGPNVIELTNLNFAPRVPSNRIHFLRIPVSRLTTNISQLTQWPNHRNNPFFNPSETGAVRSPCRFPMHSSLTCLTFPIHYIHIRGSYLQAKMTNTMQRTPYRRRS
jgi:hypothetical protein